MKASISVDLDTLNDYAYTYRLKYNKYPDPIYTVAVPRLLKLLDKYKIKATFFVVGKDLEINKHLGMIKIIKNSGHEIANHTYNHFHDFEKKSQNVQIDEIVRTERIVKNKLGLKIFGFRAPGYNVDKSTFKILKKRKYHYDSSIFPSIMLPILKLIILAKTKLKSKSTGGGELSSMFLSDEIYKVNKQLIEIPVSVVPYIRIPFMGTFNITTGRTIFEISYFIFKILRKNINFEIHPIELLNLRTDKLPEIFSIHPSIGKSIREKEKFYNNLFFKLINDYDVVTLNSMAENYRK